MNFSLDQRPAFTKVINKLNDLLESSNVVENKTRRSNMFEDNAMVFYENDHPSQHNHPLYVTAKVRDVELKRTMLDHGSSANIIFVSALDAVGVPERTL